MAQTSTEVISPGDVMLIFIIFIISVIALFLYLARGSIFRKRTDYDHGEYDSKKNRDYEKYHSEWQDDYDEYAKHNANLGEMPDHYGTLGVPPDADMETIKTRYRQLARENHPDVSDGDTADAMAAINRAYEILSDEESRKEYDNARGEI